MRLPARGFGCVLFIAGACCASDAERVLWEPPVGRSDLARGPLGTVTPQPPYSFVEESMSGTSPKMTVKDANGRVWRVKFGNEVNAQVFGSRIAWASGYAAEKSCFVRFGHVEGVKNPQRIAAHLEKGHFLSACFALNEDSLRPVEGAAWNWQDNPFAGTRELNGLKVLMMLLSNWDNKDDRDRHRGSNTLILERTAGGRRQWVYAMNDWGASMGKWGGVTSREKWDCRLFARQSPELVERAEPGAPVVWGFRGQHTESFTEGIPAEHVRWVMRYVGHLSDRQIRQALEASGAAQSETECFARALRERIALLAGL